MSPPNLRSVKPSGLVAIVSSVTPPDQSGQAQVLDRLLSDRPASRVMFLSSQVGPAADAQGDQNRWLYAKLSQFSLFYTREGFTEACWEDDPAPTLVNSVGGFIQSIFTRAEEIERALVEHEASAIVGCSGDPIDLPSAFVAALRLQVPFIAHLFDDPVHQWEDLRVTRPLAVVAERLWAPRANVVIAPNEQLARDVQLRNPGTAEIRTAIVRNPTGAAPPLHGSPWPSQGDGRLRILYTGSVYHAQADAFRNLLQALAHFRGAIELHVYSGQGSERFRQEGVESPFLTRHDAVSAAESLALQRSADILFLPLSFTRIQEVIRSSSPGKTGEYLASGRPILVHAPADTWVSQFFQERGCGAVVDQNSPDGLIAALTRIKADPTFRATLRSAQAVAADEFTLEHARREYWKHIDAAVAPRTDSPPLQPPLSTVLATRSGAGNPAQALDAARLSTKRMPSGIPLVHRPPRVLFVAMQNSPHTARWIEMITDKGWDLSLFPLDPNPLNANLCGVTVYEPQLFRPRPEHSREHPLPNYANPAAAPARIRPFRTTLGEIGGVDALKTGTVSLGESGERAAALYGPGVLASLIRELQPDLIHSMEFQHAGYLVSQAKSRYGAGFPPWLATNWGSDIFHFQQFEEHRSQIRRLLSQIDFYSCECHRDIKLARDYGFAGPVMRVLPNTGGFDLDHLQKLRSSTPPSRRKRLMIKGYQHFAGRAMISLAVLESIADRLRDYEIILYSISSEPLARAHELINAGTLNIKILGWAEHDEMLAYFGSARLYLGVSVSDAISTSVLEAMAMGAFPIQTDTSCCDEWFDDGVGGFIVSPDNVDQIRDRLIRALEDDALVDRAEAINRRTVEMRLDRQVLAPQVAEFYQPIFDDIRIRADDRKLA